MDPGKPHLECECLKAIDCACSAHELLHLITVIFSTLFLILWPLSSSPRPQLARIVADCERLVRTPVPLAYSVHTSRLLTLWVGTLPLVLVGCFTSWRRLLTVPLTAFVAWALFCTEELGHIIEEPFGAFSDKNQERAEVLPLDRYCRSLQSDLEETNRLKDRALRTLEDNNREKLAESNGDDSLDTTFGPGVAGTRSAGEEVTEDEAMEIAIQAKKTVQTVDEERRKECLGSDGEETDDELCDLELSEGISNDIELEPRRKPQASIGNPEDAPQQTAKPLAQIRDGTTGGGRSILSRGGASGRNLSTSNLYEYEEVLAQRMIESLGGAVEPITKADLTSTAP